MVVCSDLRTVVERMRVVDAISHMKEIVAASCMRRAARQHQEVAMPTDRPSGGS